MDYNMDYQLTDTMGTLVLLLLLVPLPHSEAIIVDCGGFIKGKSANHGTLSTPHYPRHYPNGSHCIWLIQAGESTVVNLTIHSLKAEGQAGSCLDYVEMRAGSKDSEVLYHGCQETEPRTIVSPRRWLWIRFYANEFIADSGFTASWRAVDNPAGTSTTPETSPIPECPHSRFACANKECISWSYVCDGFMDCGCAGGCDEDVCGESILGPVSRIAIGTICGVIIFSITILFVAIMEKKIPVVCSKEAKARHKYRKPSYIIKQQEAQLALEEIQRQTIEDERRIQKMLPPDEANYFCGNSVVRPPSSKSRSKFSLFKSKPTIVIVDQEKR